MEVKQVHFGITYTNLVTYLAELTLWWIYPAFYEPSMCATRHYVPWWIPILNSERTLPTMRSAVVSMIQDAYPTSHATYNSNTGAIFSLLAILSLSCWTIKAQRPNGCLPSIAEIGERCTARGWPLKKCSYTCLKYANFTQITQILRKLRKFYAKYAKFTQITQILRKNSA